MTPAGFPDQAPGRVGDEWYELALFINGTSPASVRAIQLVSVFCDQHLAGCHGLVVVDVQQEGSASAARALNVVATPTLVRTRPPPLRHCVGDLAGYPAVLAALDLPGAPA